MHHSDRGTQYASNDYTDLFHANGISISMSRKGNPYRDLAEARASIREFLEKVYNQKRLHSALGYVPPPEFEANLAFR